ncbi:MAG: hypothetical protein KA479_10140 [Saprospiraceae bacterium]|nr:hypothetical protein [Saprospiraceae bacterium]
MLRYFLLILSIIITHPLQLHSQKHDYNWLSGNHDFEGLGNPKFGYNILTFSDTAKLKINTLKSLNLNSKISKQINLDNVFNVYMSNEAGELEWYSNGMRIFNKNHEIMQNGDSLNFGLAWPTFNNLRSGYQWFDCQAVPIKSSSQDLSLMSHIRTSLEQHGKPVDLMYSLIDLDKNDGSGVVLLKNKIILKDTIASAGFVRHANGKDWWLLASNLNKSSWSIFYINELGLNAAHQYEYKFKSYLEEDEVIFAISPNGEYVIRPAYLVNDTFDVPNSISIYNFNRCDGQLSLKIQFRLGNINSYFVSPVISANNRFLYFLELYSQEIYQCDLESNNIGFSCQRIAKSDRKWAPFPSGFFKMGMGPDNKIYIAEGSSNYVMTVINKPNLPGLACDVYQDLFLPCYNASNVPRNPNYRLGPLANGDDCVTKFFTSGPAGVTVKPSPQGGWRMYTDKAQVLPDGPLTLVLLEQDGVTVHCTKTFLKNQFSLNLVDCDPLPGMEWYLYQDFATFARGIIE